MNNHSSTENHPAFPKQAEASLTPEFKCRKCRKPIETANIFCPYCGTRQETGNAWYYQPVWIAVLAFVLIGPFAIPLVWKSTRMGTALKLCMTALILAYTVFLGYIFYKTLMLELRTYNEMNRVLRHIR